MEKDGNNGHNIGITNGWNHDGDPYIDPILNSHETTADPVMRTVEQIMQENALS